MFVLVNPQISTRTSAILALGALEYRDAWLAVSPGPGPVVSSFPLAGVEVVLGSQVVDQPSSSQAPVLAQLTLVRLHDLLVGSAFVLDVRRLVGPGGGAGVAGVLLHVGQLVGEVLPGGAVG